MTDSGPLVRDPEWLRHRVADKQSRPGVEVAVDVTTGRIGNLISYTLLAPFETYAETATGLVDALTVDARLVVAHNRWARPGVRGLFCVLRPPDGSSVVEVQIHTAASAGAREHALLMRGLIRQADAGSAQRLELRRRRDRVLASVPVPAGARELSWPVGPHG